MVYATIATKFTCHPLLLTGADKKQIIRLYKINHTSTLVQVKNV